MAVNDGQGCLPAEVGKLAEAAGEEKSAKPLMRSEFGPGCTQQNFTLLLCPSAILHTVFPYVSDCIYLLPRPAWVKGQSLTSRPPQCC